MALVRRYDHRVLARLAQAVHVHVRLRQQRRHNGRLVVLARDVQRRHVVDLAGQVRHEVILEMHAAARAAPEDQLLEREKQRLAREVRRERNRKHEAPRRSRRK